MVLVTYYFALSSAPYSLSSGFITFSVCGLCPEACRIPVPLISSACPLGAHFGPEVCALIPLMGTWWLWPEPALDIEESFPFALWLSPPCLWWVCALVGGTEPPDLFLRCDPDLWGRQVGLEHTPGREAPEVCCSGDVPLGMCSVHLFQPLGESHVTLIGTDLGPTSTMGVPAHDPGVSPMLFSQGHQHRSPELRASVPGCGVVGAAQTTACLHPLMYEPTTSTVAKATPAVTGGVPLVLQMLCRGWVDKAGCLCKSMVSAAASRDLSFVSLTVGLSCAFSSIWACDPPTGVCSRGCPRAQGSADGGGGARGRPWLGLNRAHPGGGPSCCQGWGASSGGERLWWGSSLWASLNNGALCFVGAGFLHKHPICRAPPSLPSPQDVSSWPTTVLCLGLLSKAHVPAASPCLQWWTPLRWTPSQAGWPGQGSAPHLPLSLSCCHTRVAMFSPTESEALLLSKLGSPREWLPRVWTPLLSSDPPKLTGPIPVSLLFLLLLFWSYLAQQESFLSFLVVEVLC